MWRCRGGAWTQAPESSRPWRRRYHGPGCRRPAAAGRRGAPRGFPGGARIRPQLCLAVAPACGDDDPALTDAAAAAIELLHCASLVHDDLPCFDDAPLRRGRPSVHAAFGERAGGAGRRCADRAGLPDPGEARAASPQRLPALIAHGRRAASACRIGIVAGQAWECEPRVALRRLPARQDRRAVRRRHRWPAPRRPAPMRTPWRALGEWLGEAYQVADDIRDVVADPASSASRSARTWRWAAPSAAAELGLRRARALRAAGRATRSQPIRLRRRAARCARWCAEAERLVPHDAVRRTCCASPCMTPLCTLDPASAGCRRR